jgi:hypothetical protein
VGFGQVLADFEGKLLMAVFSVLSDDDKIPALDTIATSAPLFIANSLDAKIWNGDWTIVGKATPRLPLPKYKVQIGEAM